MPSVPTPGPTPVKARLDAGAVTAPGAVVAVVGALVVGVVGGTVVVEVDPPAASAITGAICEPVGPGVPVGRIPEVATELLG
jgi:hypothetical protein